MSQLREYAGALGAQDAFDPAMHRDTLRIAFATADYVTEQHFDCGLGQYIHRTARALAKQGHEVHVVTLSEIDEAEFEHEGVTVHRVMSGTIWRLINRLTRYRLATTIYLLDFSWQLHRKLRQISTPRPLDLVQFPHSPFCGLFSILLLRCPHILRVSWHQPSWNKLGGVRRTLDSRVVELIERLQLSRSPNIFVPCHSLQQVLANDAGLERVRVISSPIFIENEDWDYSVHDEQLKGRKYLLFFGRFELRKGLHVLAQALPRVLEQYPEAYAVLIGRDMKTALASSMADYARALCGNFAERLIVMDQLQHSQLYPIIAGAHLVVLPSLIDDLPNACLEAMVLGKPVIGTRGISFDELIADGETGFLVSPDGADALAKTIIQAWTCPMLKAMGQAAQRKTLEFAPEKTVESLLTYYREILHG